MRHSSQSRYLHKAWWVEENVIFQWKQKASFFFFLFKFTFIIISPSSSTAEPYLAMLDCKVFGFGREWLWCTFLRAWEKETDCKDSFHKLLWKVMCNYRGWQWKAEQPPGIPLFHSASCRDSWFYSQVLSCPEQEAQSAVSEIACIIFLQVQLNY